MESLYLFIFCLLGVFILGAALEGYLLKVGKLDLWARSLLAAGGFLIAFPNWNTTVIGAALVLLIIPIITIHKKRKDESEEPIIRG